MRINFHATFMQVFLTTIALAVILLFQYMIFTANDSKIILKEPMTCTFDIFQQDVDRALLEHANASTEVKCGNEWRVIDWASARNFAIKAIGKGNRTGIVEVICSQYRWRWAEETVNACATVTVDED